MKELALQLAVEAIKMAREAGLNRVILGASPEVMHAIVGGQKLGTPLPILRLSLGYDDGMEVEVRVPMFCDPGLAGRPVVYAIEWPTAPAIEIAITD